MASNLLRLHLQTTLKASPPISISPSSLSFTNPSPHKRTLCSFPPTSREEAISQAKLSLSSTLKKPLNNPIPVPTRKLKKLTQPRFRVEIPVVDDSPNSLIQLAFVVFANLPITRKGSIPATLILWPNPTLAQLALQTFSSATSVTNSDLSSVGTEILNSADLAVFLAPEKSQVEDIKRVTTSLYPKPVVLFNPNWAFDEEKDFEMGNFLDSFDVVYSFMGLEVRGVIKRRKGVVFKCVKDGVVSGEVWEVMVEDEEGEEKGKLKVVTRFKRRPTIVEVESVLYNLMAANSPVTKSVKFLKDLVSNVTGKKDKQ
ncbi:uncharacterized protein A4U43_C03F9420 [Asparagus officinalis]|uniref:DUF1995 domain-containing protein n=1 Tax=Asparagus officinalis TaxID=4686 RepID=A0A5P1FBE0_ASPOF|nr:uncharacterized protein LOC109833302 [Asparagus officinalis]ONK74717.1 uncharacterized protein A4U43_C03F9420 [Asparagus officinalis]